MALATTPHGRATRRSLALTRLALCSTLLAAGHAAATSFTVSGALALSDGDANDTRQATLVVAATSLVAIQSYGYGGSASAPGGVDAAGDVVPAGGFDPYVSLFAGSGDAATLVASNDDGLCGPGTPDGGRCGDSTLTLALAPGTYTLVIAAFANASIAENNGSGTLGDGMTGLGNYDPARTTAYAVDVGILPDALFANGFE